MTYAGIRPLPKGLTFHMTNFLVMASSNEDVDYFLTWNSILWCIRQGNASRKIFFGSSDLLTFSLRRSRYWVVLVPGCGLLCGNIRFVATLPLIGIFPSLFTHRQQMWTSSDVRLNVPPVSVFSTSHFWKRYAHYRHLTSVELMRSHSGFRPKRGCFVEQRC